MRFLHHCSTWIVTVIVAFFPLRENIATAGIVYDEKLTPRLPAPLTHKLHT